MPARNASKPGRSLLPPGSSPAFGHRDVAVGPSARVPTCEDGWGFSQKGLDRWQKEIQATQRSKRRVVRSMGYAPH